MKDRQLVKTRTLCFEYWNSIGTVRCLPVRGNEHHLINQNNLFSPVEIEPTTILL